MNKMADPKATIDHGFVTFNEVRYSHEWEIDDFDPTETGYYNSPIFTCNGVKWQLYLHPRSDLKIHTEDFVAVYLQIKSTENVAVKYEIFLLDEKNNKFISLSSHGKKHFHYQKIYRRGSSMFCKRADIVENRNRLMKSNTLRLLCEITYFEPNDEPKVDRASKMTETEMQSEVTVDTISWVEECGQLPDSEDVKKDIYKDIEAALESFKLPTKSGDEKAEEKVEDVRKDIKLVPRAPSSTSSIKFSNHGRSKKCRFVYNFHSKSKLKKQRNPKSNGSPVNEKPLASSHSPSGSKTEKNTGCGKRSVSEVLKDSRKKSLFPWEEPDWLAHISAKKSTGTIPKNIQHSAKSGDEKSEKKEKDKRKDIKSLPESLGGALDLLRILHSDLHKYTSDNNSLISNFESKDQKEEKSPDEKPSQPSPATKTNPSIEEDFVIIPNNEAEDSFAFFISSRNPWNDITLRTTDGFTLYANKSDLATHSEFFRTYFKFCSIVSTIEVNYLSGKAVIEMLRFMYKKEVNNLERMADALFKLSKVYGIPDLRRFLIEELLKTKPLAIYKEPFHYLSLAKDHDVPELTEMVNRIMTNRYIL